MQNDKQDNYFRQYDCVLFDFYEQQRYDRNVFLLIAYKRARKNVSFETALQTIPSTT